MTVGRIISKLGGAFLHFLAPVVIDGAYGGFFKYREKKIRGTKTGRFHYKLYHTYLFRYGAYIGERAVFRGKPRLPHYLFGIFISNQSVIGEKVVIYQQVTIGTNSLEGHEKLGAPVIGNNVVIGAGAKIIGNVKIGDNCRIGANCVVTRDMESNTTAVGGSTRYIKSEVELDNTLVCLDEIVPDPYCSPSGPKS